MTQRRTSRMGFRHRLIGWIAAYALVLQAALAGVVATQVVAAKGAAHTFEICLTDPDGAPVPANHTQHENCAIHCNAVASGAPNLATVITAHVFAPCVASKIAYSSPATSFDLLRRAGLGSRAPPAA